MEALLVKVYRFMARQWNALLAGTSLAGVAAFSIVPPLQKYVPLFVFAAANAVVWTLIELKTGLGTVVNRATIHQNMRIARPSIVADIEKGASRATNANPLHVVLIGGRIRAMSDIVREVSDNLHSGRASGHVVMDVYALDPVYLQNRVLPGYVPLDKQEARNSTYANIVVNLAQELEGLNVKRYIGSSFSVRVRHYATDPTVYAYIVGTDALYWGPFTWSDALSDFVGPENPCFVHYPGDEHFQPIRAWILNRSELYGREWQDGSATSVEGETARSLHTEIPPAVTSPVASKQRGSDTQLNEQTR